MPGALLFAKSTPHIVNPGRPGNAKRRASPQGENSEKRLAAAPLI